MINIQTRLICKEKQRRQPDKVQLNVIKKGVQHIKTSEGCPHLCPFCYEDNKLVVWDLPEIKCNMVEIKDMNFLWQPNIIDRIKALRKKGVKFKEVCGFDFRLLTPEICKELKNSNFFDIKIAWDWHLKDQYKIGDVIKWFLKAGYKEKDISCFMLANWEIPLWECELKIDALKTWNIKVCDCCYDGGYKYAVPEDWTQREIDYFRHKCALHNQLVQFKLYPDLQRARNIRDKILHAPLIQSKRSVI